MQLYIVGKLDPGDWKYMEYMVPDFIAALNAAHPPVSNLAGHHVYPLGFMLHTYSSKA